MTPLWVALGGGLGAGARFVLDGILTSRSTRGLPIATLVINVVGSFLLGLVTGWLGTNTDGAMRAVLGTGFLGGFTTFSTASVELVRLHQAERPRAAALLAVTMVTLGVAAALVGWLMGRWLA